MRIIPEHRTGLPFGCPPGLVPTQLLLWEEFCNTLGPTMQRLRLSGASLLKTKWSRFSFHARSFSTGHPPVVPVDEGMASFHQSPARAILQCLSPLFPEFRAHLDFKGFKANHEVLKHVVETRFVQSFRYNSLPSSQLPRMVVTNRNMTADVDKVITLYEQFTELTQQINEKRKGGRGFEVDRGTPFILVL